MIRSSLGRCAVAAALLGSLGSLVSSAPRPVDVGSDRQLFIDESLVGSKRDVTLVVNPPVKTGERNIVADKPWESFYAGGWNTVMDDGGIVKLWYESSSIDARFRGLCYATSTDGIHWVKPELGLVAFGGSTRNNIVREAHGAPGSVFLDPRRPDGNRFKYLEFEREPGKERPPTLSLPLYTSPDGLRWQRSPGKPMLTMKDQFDTQNQIFWDERIGKYVGYVRLNERVASRHRRFASYPLRRAGRFETDDLSRCPIPTVVFSSDAQDPEESDHYTICVVKYPFARDVYLMFPSSYLHDLEARRNNDDGPLDIQLATSRDGIRWLRPDRRPYVRRGLDSSSDGGSLYMTIGMLRRGAEIWMYYTGYDFTHGGYDKQTTRYKGVVSRLVQRLDGFLSLDSAYAGGEVTTVPLVFRGSRLRLNVDTSAMGTARVEILDEAGRPVPGFGLAESDVINGNFIDREVTWKGSGDVGALAGKPVRLRFVSRSTKLYAFQFVR